MILLCAVDAAAQLPVRTRQLQLISNTNTTYTAVESADALAANWTLTLPPTEGADYSLLYSDVTGTDASLTWLAPATAGYVLASGGAGSPPTWTDLSGVYWSLTGNATTTAWNGAAGSFLGTTSAQPLSIATTNAAPQDINFYTGVSGANNRMTIEGDGDIFLRGTAGTPNVTLTSVSGVANAVLPVGYDRVLIANNTGLVTQASYSAVVNTTAWTLTGNTGTTAFDGVTGNYIGTNDAQDWVWVTNNTFRGRLVGGAVNTGNLVLGYRNDDLAPFNADAAAATDRLTILGGNLSLNSENNGAITREITFRGTAGSGNFRIGSDGGDIFWQGGGGQMLQMGSFWGIQLIGNRGVIGAPAFTGGAAANPAVDVIGTRTGAPILTTTPPLGFTANQQEWRSPAGTAQSVVNNRGYLGLGLAGGVSSMLHINSTNTSGNAILIDPWGAAAGNTGEIRQLELAANGANYIAWKAADNMAVDNTYTWPSAYPTANNYVLVSTTAGVTSWADPGTLITAWQLTGNSNALATSFIGPTVDNTPMNIATAAAVPGDINFFIGTVAAGNRRMQLTNVSLDIGTLANNVNTSIYGNLAQTGNAVIASAVGSNVAMLNAATPGNLLVNGTAGTPNVTLGSLSGAANAVIPAGFDRFVVANNTGQLSQVSYAAVINANAWSLTGNAGTNPATNFLGTTDAQPLVIRTNNTEAIRVLTTGNVGIGTATPGQLLEVEDGNVLIGTSAAGTAGQIQLQENGVSGNDVVSFQAPAALANSTAYTLPAATGTAGQALVVAAAPVPTATAATLQWATITATPVVQTINVNADNFAAVQNANTTFLRLNSDNLPANRTTTIANGTTDGQVLTIRCVAAAAANGVQFADGGNMNLSGGFNMNNGDTITLIWDAATVQWLETARRNN